MTILFDATSKGASTSSPCQFNHTIGSGKDRLLVVGVAWEDDDGSDPPDVSAITFNGQAMNLIQKAWSAPSGFHVFVGMWYLLETDLPSSGPYQVSISTDQDPYRTIFGFAISYSGVKQTAPDAYGNTWNSSSPEYHTLTVANDGSVQVGTLSCRNTGTFGTYNGSTVRQSYSQDSSSAGFVDNFKDAGSENIGATHSSPNADLVMAATWSPATYKITGTTYDLDGEPLGSVKCFLCKDNGDDTCTYLDYDLSNATTGVYLFTGIEDDDSNYFVIAWKDDSPHVKDVTDHNLEPESE